MTSITREIKFDRETRDYACFLNGEIVAYASNHFQAERTLDELVLGLIEDGLIGDATLHTDGDEGEAGQLVAA